MSESTSVSIQGTRVDEREEKRVCDFKGQLVAGVQET